MGGGYSQFFSSYIGSAQSSTVYPQKISGISSIPKYMFQILAYPQNIFLFYIDLKKHKTVQMGPN